MKKILFICSANRQRSKTAEDYFSEKHPSMEFRSAGTNHKICRQAGTIPLTEDLLAWADKIFVMEKKHFEMINEHVGTIYNPKLRILNIPDRFKYFQKELLELLDVKVSI
ncbi:MAG: phosphotyrosine protein phosphatase [Bacteroidota bacterium]